MVERAAFRAHLTLRWRGDLLSELDVPLRTKLLGEKRIEAIAKQAECVIVRPTVIVDLEDILDIGNWSLFRKFLQAYRHSHQIYVKDVVYMILSFMERSLARPVTQPGVEVFNLSNDDVGYKHARLPPPQGI